MEFLLLLRRRPKRGKKREDSNVVFVVVVCRIRKNSKIGGASSCIDASTGAPYMRHQVYRDMRVPYHLCIYNLNINWVRL